MTTYSFTIPLFEIAIMCAAVGAVILSIGVVYALGVVTGPRCDGESFVPVIKSLPWKE